MRHTWAGCYALVFKQCKNTGDKMMNVTSFKWMMKNSQMTNKDIIAKQNWFPHLKALIKTHLLPVLPTNSQQTLLYGIPLGLGEAAAFGQAVDGVEEGVNQWSKRLCPRKQRRTFSQERQHSCTKIPVEGECHVCGTESNLAQRQRQRERGGWTSLCLYDWVGLHCWGWGIKEEQSESSNQTSCYWRMELL